MRKKEKRKFVNAWWNQETEQKIVLNKENMTNLEKKNYNKIAMVFN